MLKVWAVSHATPIVTSRGALQHQELLPCNAYRQGMLCSRLLHTFRVGMFKYNKTNSTTIKHICNECANLIECYDVAFDTNDWWNPFKTVPVIGMEGMVTRACLRYTWDYLTLGICSLFKLAAMEKLISFSAKIHIVML